MTDNSQPRPPIPGLICEPEISRELRCIRRSIYVFTTVPKTRISEYEQNGWEIAKRNKKTCRMGKPKSHDVLLEDRVWVMLAKLKWTWMNKDRYFRLRHAKSEKDRGKQIDVFAADNETAIIAECKSSEQLGKTESFSKDINEISGIRTGVLDNLRKSFGTKQKTAWLFFTHNYRVGEIDGERFQEQKIFHVTEDELSYYEQLVEHLGPVAKYQLFSRLFKDQEIPELDARVPALRAKTAGYVVYSFLIEPELLLKIGHVLHRTSATSSDLGKYQRIVNKSRIREIQRFIEKQDGFFPNSIILNIQTKTPLQFDLGGGGSHSSSAALGVLHLPRRYHSAMIIDGQHSPAPRFLWTVI